MFIIVNSFESKLLTFFCAFILSINWIKCSNSYQYIIGYNDGYSDAISGSGNKYISNSNRYKFLFQDLNKEFPEPNGNQATDGSANNGNLFGFDENEFQSKWNQLSDNCQQMVTPELGTCIEKAANKRGIDAESKNMGPNECKALWDLMCCAIVATEQQCSSADLKAIELGFSSLQTSLENKECSATPRSTVGCAQFG